MKYQKENVIGREDDFENIDEIVWYLMDLAEEFDGEYDGWGCHIVKQREIAQACSSGFQ